MQVRRIVTVCAIAVALFTGALSSEAIAAPAKKSHATSHKKHAAKHSHHKHHSASKKSKG